MCAVHNIVGVQRIAIWEAEQWLRLAEDGILVICDSCRFTLRKIIGEAVAANMPKIKLDKRRS